MWHKLAELEISKKNVPLLDRNTNKKDPAEILVHRGYVMVQACLWKCTLLCQAASLREELLWHSVHPSLLMAYKMAVTFVADRKTNRGQLLTNIFKVLLSFACQHWLPGFALQKKLGKKKKQWKRRHQDKIFLHCLNPINRNRNFLTKTGSTSGLWV